MGDVYATLLGKKVDITPDAYEEVIYIKLYLQNQTHIHIYKHTHIYFHKEVSGSMILPDHKRIGEDIYFFILHCID